MTARGHRCPPCHVAGVLNGYMGLSRMDRDMRVCPAPDKGKRLICLPRVGQRPVPGASTGEGSAISEGTYRSCLFWHGSSTRVLHQSGGIHVTELIVFHTQSYLNKKYIETQRRPRNMHEYWRRNRLIRIRYLSALGCTL